MVHAVIGQKSQQIQGFLENGKRIPMTEIIVSGNPVVAVKSLDKHGYWAVQVGFGTRKKPTKSLQGHVRGAKLEKTPRFLREIRLADVDTAVQVGDIIKPSDVLKPGDIIDVTGTSKGKGFAGVVKRHGFRGGPRTHGQSDRERAPGSIGQTTTPGRVYRGKRMAGRMGQDRVTIKNLEVVGVTDSAVYVHGLVPGSVNSLIMITKTGENKKFVPLFKEPTPEIATETPEQPLETAATLEEPIEEKVDEVDSAKQKVEKVEEMIEPQKEDKEGVQ